MSEEIKKLEPQILWENFYKLTQMPRPSKKELKAAEQIKLFGESLGLETLMDETGNVIIRKPATPGFEKRKGVILQGHIDMVPQANSGSDFNFETDPIDAYIDGDWVRARGTTLGADNGIGVAASMAVLQSTKLKHGPVEVLVTIDEESGMTGAFGLQGDVLKGDILINMDSEDEDDISVGCAGGMNVNFEWNFKDAKVPVGVEAFNVEITGLKGGHSGLDIHLGRGNACKLMGRFLKKAINLYGVRISLLDCGNMRNAIPREAFAVVTVPKSAVDNFQWLIAQMQTTWMNELGRVEPDLSIKTTHIELPGSVIPLKIQHDVVAALCAARNGIIRLSDSMPGVVESSTNLSIVKSSEGKISGMCLVRSFVDTARDNVASSLESGFELSGAAVHMDGKYPGWKPDPESSIQELMKTVFKMQHNKEPNVVAMHAGLECGILGATYPAWDMVSVGPTINYPHSPDERVHIKSVNKFWDFLVEVLENIPEK